MRFYYIIILSIILADSLIVRALGEDNAPSISRQPLRQRIVKRINCEDGTELLEYSNGMALFLKSDSAASESTVRLLVRKTGSINEQNLTGSGISHLVEQLLISGRSRNNTAAEIRARLGRLGTMEESFTDYEMSGFSVCCANENLPAAIELFTDQICNADLNQKEFDGVKRRLSNEFANRSENRLVQGKTLLMQTCYLQHPMRCPVYGWQPLFENLSLSDVERFYRERYCPNNFIFAVSGRFDRDKILAKFQTFFDNKDRRGETEIPLQYEQNQIASRFSAREMEGDLTDLYFAWPTVTGANREIYALKLLAVLLADGAGSRLNRKFREEKQYILSVESIGINPQTIRGIFALHARVYPAETAAFRQGVLAEIERIKTEPLSEAELFRARKKVESEYLVNRETRGEEIERKARSYLLTGNPDFDSHFLRELKEVTSEKIQQTVQKFFRQEYLSEIMICPPGQVPPAVDSIKKKDPEQELSPGISAFLCKQNKLRLIVKRVPRLGFVNISVHILCGTHLDSDETAGRSAILSRMLFSGSGEHSRSAITRWFDSIGGKLSVTVTGNAIRVSATVLKEDCLRTTELLANCLAKPEYLPEEFERARKETLALIRMKKSQASSEVLALFYSRLPESTPLRYPENGTEHSISNLTLDNIREFGTGILSSSNMIFTIFGDFQGNYAVPELEKATAALTQSKNFPTISFDRPNDLREQIDFHQRTNREIAAGLIAWPTVSAQKDEEYLALLIFKTILTGRYDKNGLLHRRIIDKNLAYTIVSVQQETPVPGYFFIYFETIPERLSAGLAAIEQEVRRICEIGISEEDFELAKQELTASLYRKNKTLEEQARQAALDDMYFNNYERFQHLEGKIRNIRLEYMMEVIRRNMARKGVIITTSNQARRQ